MIRETLSSLAQRSTASRGTVREFDDKHLMQQIKTADVYYSESPTNFERWQPAGFTSYPKKQEQQQQQQSSSGSQQSGTGGVGGQFNNNQPTGPAAEAVILYINGQRSHPVAFVDDRRVRPHSMKEGESAVYSLDGSGQMLLHKANGMYLVTTDTAAGEGQQEQKRFVSIRHVVKQKQTRKLPKEGGTDESYKHEGESVNTEVKTSEKKIEFMDGDKVVAHYDRDTKQWNFDAENGALYGTNGRYILIKNKKIYLGLSSKDEDPSNFPKVITEEGPSDIVFAKKSD